MYTVHINAVDKAWTNLMISIFSPHTHTHIHASTHTHTLHLLHNLMFGIFSLNNGWFYEVSHTGHGMGDGNGVYTRHIVKLL